MKDRLLRLWKWSPLGGVGLRIAVVILLVSVLAWAIDFRQALAMLKGTNLYWVACGFCLVQVQVVLSAWRWQITAVRLGQKLSLSRAVGEYYLATVANLSLPGGVTGDAARVVRNRGDDGWQQVTQGVMLERLAGQLILFLIAFLGWVLWPFVMSAGVPASVGHMLTVAMVVVFVFGLAVFLIIRFATQSISQFVTSFGPAIRRVWLTDGQWLMQTILSILVVATYLGVFLASSYALAQPIPLIALFTIVPIVLLSMALPISVGGWGVREAAAASLWPVAGLLPEAGVATSVLYGLISLLAALPAALLIQLISGKD